MRVEPLQPARQPVVLPQPERVHGGQPGLLVRPLVARLEAVQVGGRDAALLVGRSLVERREERLPDVEVRVAELAVLEEAEVVELLLGGAVHVGGVDEGGHLEIGVVSIHVEP